MSRSRSCCLLIAAVLTLLSACSGSATQTNVVECSSIIDEVDNLPVAYVELANAAGIPALADGMQVGRSDDGYRFSKFGIAIRNGVQATVSVVPASGDAYLGFGGLDEESVDRSQPVHFVACPSGSAAWVIYAGGVWTTENGCVTMTVTSAQATESLVVGVGMPC